MSCEDTRGLLHAYVDGELDLVRSLEMEKHIEGCKDCARVVENQQALGTALRSGSLYYRTPRELKPRVDAALRRAARPDAPARRIPWSMLAVAAGLLLAGLFLGRFLPVRSQPDGRLLVAQEVLDSHLRSLMPGHLADVQSSDRHTVKPWFNGKLDFSPPVNDFAEQGFPLTGGRLDSVDGRAVAVLVYQRRLHVINLYIWPAASSMDSGVTETTRQGYNILHWTRDGLNWWLASDVNAAELRNLAVLLRANPTIAPSTP
jgi:anti-sigma factor RsiW